MRVKIYGGETWMRDLARQATRFVLTEAFSLSEAKCSNTTVYIRFVRDQDDYYGCAYANTDNSYNSSSYTVKINLDHVESTIVLHETIMHELVHVAQMAHRKILRYTYSPKANTYVAYWKGKAYDPDKAYSRQPWERQAYYWESKLVKMFYASGYGKRLPKNKRPR